MLWLLEIFGAGGHGHSHGAEAKEGEIKEGGNGELPNKPKKTIKERAQIKLEQIKPTKENVQRLGAYMKSINKQTTIQIN